MKAFFIDHYGGKRGLRAGEMPDRSCGRNDLLVQIHAAGVNLLDAKIKDGEFKLILPYRLPRILGNDVAGVVVQVGSRVRRFKVGDEVYARPVDDRIGTFAQFIAINEDAVAMKPKNLSMEEAASIPLVGLTAWQAAIHFNPRGFGLRRNRTRQRQGRRQGEIKASANPGVRRGRSRPRFSSGWGCGSIWLPTALKPHQSNRNLPVRIVMAGAPTRSITFLPRCWGFVQFPSVSTRSRLPLCPAT